VIALELLRLTTGAFYVVTGARKCLLPAVRARVVPFIERTSHCPPALAYAVIGGEFAGGLGLLSGVLWQWAALGLIPIMLGAYIGDTLPTVRAKQAAGSWSWSQFASNAMCTPEFQLLAILLALALDGFIG
jgi:uncharacterized membrane protein YphA (DoxX/SURF4 family)